MVLLETIDDVFSSLGSSCKQVIYFHLEKNFAIKKKEIPLKIEDFANALEQLFGDGARFIELKIIATLHKRTPNFTHTPASGDLVFADYLTSLRRFLITRNCKSDAGLYIKGKQDGPQLLQSKTKRIFS